MSLLICSSSQSRYNNKSTGITRPFNFKNYLGNTMEIPKHSEVAVQSVKIDRRGKFEIREHDNDRGFVMFGKQYDNVADTDPPNYVEDFATSLLPFIIPEGVYDVQHFNSVIKSAVDKACLFHPDLVCKSVIYNKKSGTESIENLTIELSQRVNTGVIASDMVEISGSTLGMSKAYAPLCEEGGIDIGKYPAPDDTTAPPVVAYSLFDPLKWTEATGKWEGQDFSGAGFNVCMFPDCCMSFQAGQFNVDISNAVASEWTCGVVRDQACGHIRDGDYANGEPRYTLHKNFAGNQDRNRGCPIGFDPLYDGITFPAQKGWNEAFFYDYSVGVEKDDAGVFRLEVYASCFETNDNTEANRMGNTCVPFRDIPYEEDTGQTLAGAEKYNMTTNTLGLTKVHWIFDGENVILRGTFTAGVSDIVRGRATATGGNCFPPLVSSKLRLHPKLSIENTSGKYLSVEASYGRLTTTAEHKQHNRGYGHSWFGENAVDCYFGETPSSSDRRIGNCVNSQQITAPPLANVGGGGKTYIDYQVGLILNEEDESVDMEDRYFDPHWLSAGACCSEALGFTGIDYFLDHTNGTAVVQGLKWTSAELPEGISFSSIFISCPTLTQLSQNFGHGTPSKILYHIPQFSNSGEGTGSLFFEATEKTYLRLGNSEPIHLDHLEIQVKNSDETLCEELEGETIVVLHIRRERR